MRYQVPGVPAKYAGSAFTPALVRLAASGAQAFKNAVVGQPGTQGIPAPYPAGVSQDATYTALHKSSDAPRVWYPQLWYQDRLTNHAGGEAGGPAPSIYSTHQMPIPAVDPRGVPAVMANPALFLGGRQIRTDKVLPRWPNIGG